MQALRIHEHGGPEVLQYGDFPDPHPEPGWVVVRVEACSLNYLDIFSRRGMPGIRIELPSITGGDCSGEIAELGSGVEGWSFPPPEGDALLDQKGCWYLPHVQGMRTGQSLSIKTSDPTAHNVHGYAKVNRPFNRSQPAGAANVEIRMRKSEASPPMKVKCDIHPWMNAYVAVVDHPFFAVTGADGSFAFAQLPAGTYTIAAWHEKYGVIEQTVTIADNEAKAVDFDYSG